MQSSNVSLGKIGESASASLLQKKGFKILKRNIRINIGEIDIIASKQSVLYVFEVKTRRNTSHGQPYEAVTPLKAKRLLMMGEKFALQNNLKDSKLSLGVIAVIVDERDNEVTIKIYDYFQ